MAKGKHKSRCAVGCTNRYTKGFQQFVMILMKLCLNLEDQDLAYRFGVNQSTIARHVKKWIDILYIRLGPLVKWPDRGELVRTQPMEFRKSFGKCVVIIDCFEVFMKDPLT